VDPISTVSTIYSSIGKLSTLIYTLN
jgi:hypothetical protein